MSLISEFSDAMLEMIDTLGESVTVNGKTVQAVVQEAGSQEQLIDGWSADVCDITLFVRKTSLTTPPLGLQPITARGKNRRIKNPVDCGAYYRIEAYDPMSK